MSVVNSSNNASITICEYEEVYDRSGFLGWIFPKKRGVWKMLAWDDYSRDVR
jgi:hypothetical protein